MSVIDGVATCFDDGSMFITSTIPGCTRRLPLLRIAFAQKPQIFSILRGFPHPSASMTLVFSTTYIDHVHLSHPLEVYYPSIAFHPPVPTPSVPRPRSFHCPPRPLRCGGSTFSFSSRSPGLPELPSWIPAFGSVSIMLHASPSGQRRSDPPETLTRRHLQIQFNPIVLPEGSNSLYGLARIISSSWLTSRVTLLKKDLEPPALEYRRLRLGHKDGVRRGSVSQAMASLHSRLPALQPLSVSLCP